MNLEIIKIIAVVFLCCCAVPLTLYGNESGNDGCKFAGIILTAISMLSILVLLFVL